jgi:hypothetical protein
MVILLEEIFAKVVLEEIINDIIVTINVLLAI